MQPHDMIRARPHMYLGDGGSLSTLKLLRGLLGCPLEPRSIVIVLDSGAITIRSKCVPPAAGVTSQGELPYFIEICSRLNVPVDTPPSVASLTILDTDCSPPAFKNTPVVPPYMAIANALSERFRIVSLSRGFATIAEFEHGILTSQPRTERTMEYDGLELQFVFDKIPAYGEFGSLGPFDRFDLVAEVARDVALVRNVPITVAHWAGGTFTAIPRGG